MKTTKQILCMVLVLVLTAGLFVPASAEEESSYAPIITKQPTGPARAYVGDTFVLEVDAELPAGVQGELTYDWHISPDIFDGVIISNDGKIVEVVITEDMAQRASFRAGFSAVVSNNYKDNNEDVSISTKAETVIVMIAHPYAPLITEQPPEDLSIQFGSTTTLKMQAELPQGAPGTLSYAWYDYDWNKEGNVRAPVCTESTLEISFPLKDIVKYLGKTYYPVAINTFTDDNGVTQSVYTQGTGVNVFGKLIISEMKPGDVALMGIGSLLLIPICTPLFLLLSPIGAFTGGYGIILIAPLLLPFLGVYRAFEYFFMPS